jgi:hypothetical protein
MRWTAEFLTHWLVVGLAVTLGALLLTEVLA